MDGQIVVGTVSRIESFGIFVSFGERTAGLVPRSLLSDNRQIARTNSLNGLFNVGDSILALVSKVDSEKGRISLSLRQSEIYSHAVDRPSFFGALAAGVLPLPCPSASGKGCIG